MGRIEEIQNPLEITTRTICQNGDLTPEYAITLAQMVDARDKEIKRLLSRLQIAEEALNDAKEVSRCQHLELKRHIDQLIQDRPFNAVYIRQVEYRLDHLHKELGEALEQIRRD